MSASTNAFDFVGMHGCKSGLRLQVLSSARRCPRTAQIAICLNHFVLMEVCLVEILLACLKGDFFQRDASTRARWSDTTWYTARWLLPGCKMVGRDWASLLIVLFLINATEVHAGQSTPRTARDVGVIRTSPPKACSESDEASAGTSCSATAHVPLLDGNHKTIGHQKLSSQAI